MGIYKTVRHLTDEQNDDIIIYERTSTDQVIHRDATLGAHVDSLIASAIGMGLHGIRYNQQENAIEYLNPDTKEWEPIIIPNPVVIANG